MNDYTEAALLPTDREGWTDRNLNPARKFDNLPHDDQKQWRWEGPWQYVLDPIDGVKPDQDGWVYAFNFPHSFSTKSGMKSFVRKFWTGSMRNPI